MSRSAHPAIMTVGVEPEPFPTQEMSLSIPDNCYILSGAWCLSGVASS